MWYAGAQRQPLSHDCSYTSSFSTASQGNVRKHTETDETASARSATPSMVGSNSDAASSVWPAALRNAEERYTNPQPWGTTAALDPSMDRQGRTTTRSRLHWKMEGAPPLPFFLCPACRHLHKRHNGRVASLLPLPGERRLAALQTITNQSTT